MGLFRKRKDSDDVAATSNGKDLQAGESAGEHNTPIRLMRPYIFAMGMIVSIGGFIFGYDTGQISGFLEMPDFLYRFHNLGDQPNANLPNPYAFSDVRSGTIVGLLSIGTLLGALLSAPVADTFGRRVCIVFWNIIFCVGVIVQISTSFTWYQIALGRWVAGLGVGGLSVLTPMYMSETAPRHIRGAMVGCYQLFITLGILVAYLINFGTKGADGAAQWRIPMGVGFIWPVLMILGIVFLPESPRWDYRHDRIERATRTVSRSYGVHHSHFEVRRELREIREKLEAEKAGSDDGKHKWYEIFTGPRMAYRTLLGITLQALQQLTGANFFFYYGTTIFQATGLRDSFVTSIILGAVNFAMTFPGLYVVEKAGRRKALIAGAAWMFVCFMVFSSVGHFALDRNNPQTTPQAGTAMIVFACLFIAGYAMTWGPVVWVVVGELFPTRYRTACMGLSSASNWIWNFLISFFTPFITSAIDFRYGYIFAGCTFAAIPIVYFFLEEHQGRSLEEIDTMYITHVPPRKSSSWIAPEGEDLVTADKLYLEPGARGIRKQTNDESRVENAGEGVRDVEEKEKEEDEGSVHAAGARGDSIS